MNVAFLVNYSSGELLSSLCRDGMNLLKKQDSDLEEVSTVTR